MPINSWVESVCRTARRVPGCHSMLARVGALLLGASLVGSSGVAFGHHSFAAYFAIDESMEVQGVVTEFWIANPHSRIYLDVRNEKNEIEQWMAEGGSRNVYARTGISAETITPGMIITVRGSPSRDGSKSIGIKILTNEEGAQIWPPQ